MQTDLSDIVIQSQVLPLDALGVEFDRAVEKFRSRREADAHTRIVLPDGRRLAVTDRFWVSFGSLNGLNRSVFDYFSHGEVFSRITKVKGDLVRMTYESGADGSDGRLLSCTKPSKPLLRVDQVLQLVNDFQGQKLTYSNGVATADFNCPFPMEFQVGGDDFKTRFMLELPLDGFGLPAAYLALLRLICSNGLVGVSHAFRTVFQLGRDEAGLDVILRRVMATFANEEGFHSFRQRIESSAQSWASLHEASQLRTVLGRAMADCKCDPATCATILERLDKACGEPLAFYGLTNGDEISVRKARTIPVEATIYDLLNFASEVATHHLSQRIPRSRINTWTGSVITGEYDLEGTVDVFPAYRDFFLSRNASGGMRIPVATETEQSPSAPAPEKPTEALDG